ncbi:GTPase Era [uncultured Phascolarctobacterium sp.]|uniref:GTPase Era n=1 Tax=uncultured Phascolarctobacterium sp. TaxID=512296 RepID=UPI00261F62E1|nr:GTPase Era [uncultured Phascolarctobacterium sp.]
MQAEPKHYAGFVAMVGRPNVGKSTLTNSLIGEKIAIMSDRPQTTRNRIMCIMNTDNAQIMFLDTPGIHKPHHKLGEYMVRTAEGTLQEVDVILFIVDVTEKRGAGEDYILELLKKVKTPVILVCNKIDKLQDKSKLFKIMEDYSKLYKFAALVPVSALTDGQFPDLVQEITKLLPEGPAYYPDDMITDQPERVIAGEMIREKVLRLTRDEVPHAIAVEVDEFKERDDENIYIRATIFVERESQKGIIIGAKGGMLKKIGQQARADLEKLLYCKIYLDLWVKVKPDWRNQDKALKQFGYNAR